MGSIITQKSPYLFNNVNWTPNQPPGGGYNVNPAPTSGTGAFGLVPGPVGVPPSIYEQVRSLYPRISGSGNTALSNIDLELGGNVDRASLQNDAAAYGINSGMPGSGFVNVGLLNRTDRERQAQRRLGNQDLLSFITGIGGTQTDPHLAYQIAEENANKAAAPNPETAFQAQQALYDRYRNNQSPAGGTGKYDQQMKALEDELARITASIGQPQGGGGGYRPPTTSTGTSPAIPGGGTGSASGPGGDFYAGGGNVYQGNPLDTFDEQGNLIPGGVQTGGLTPFAPTPPGMPPQPWDIPGWGLSPAGGRDETNWDWFNSDWGD